MSEEMRKEFENTLWDKFSRDFNVSRKRAFNYSENSDEYINSFVNDMYFMWKKSREAMNPIKLPTKMKNTQEQSCYYYNDAVDECKEAIQQAGYKVAE